ncbi:F-box protein CPR1 [Linum grandiflorum]
MSDYLPHDVITREVLFRLPVVSLLRCRSVCKQWRTLIDSPEFINRHINHSTTTTMNAVLYLLDENDDGIYPILHLTGLRRQSSFLLPPPFPYLPAKSPFGEAPTVFGSCRGLLCLRYTSTDQIHILNRATRSQILSEAVLPDGFMTRYGKAGYSSWELDAGYGFGYDLGSDDYKVVRICHLIGQGGEKRESEVISFGFKSRICQPEEYGGEKGAGYFLSLGELKNCLCIFANFIGKSVHVWMMKDYGVESSWSKLFCVPNSTLSYNFSLVPLGLSMIGDEILLHLDGERLVWIDMEKRQGAEQITILGWEGGKFDAVVCFESLVPP